MSFGISISDIICLANLAKQTYINCTEACAKHATITAEVRTLRSVLRRVRNEATWSTTLLEQSPHGKELMDTVEECTTVLNQINKTLQKHSSLSTKRPTLRDRLGSGTKDFGELRRQLSTHQRTITLLILSTTSSAARNIDASLDTVVDEFPQIQRAINSLVAETKSKAGSVWTAYSDDDPYTWRQIRRDLNMAGIPSKTVRKYRRQIESYIRSLQLGSSLNLERIETSLDGAGIADIVPAVIPPLAPEPSSAVHDSYTDTYDLELCDGTHDSSSSEAGYESRSESETGEETDWEDSLCKMKLQVRAAKDYIRQSRVMKSLQCSHDVGSSL